VITRGAGSLWLADVDADGRVLVTHPEFTNAVVAQVAGSREEQDLSWVGTLTATDIAADGKTLVFWSSGGQPNHSIYSWDPSGGKQPKRLGDGISGAFSPDGAWVLAVSAAQDRLSLVPVGVGQERTLVPGQVARYMAYATPDFTPDGKRVIFCGSEEGKPWRLWIQDVEGDAPPRALGPEGACGAAVNDGRWVATFQVDLESKKEKPILLSLDGSGKTKPIPGLVERDWPVWMSADGKQVIVISKQPEEEGANWRMAAWRIDLGSGKRTLWKDVTPTFRPGFAGYRQIAIDPSGRYSAYTYQRILEVLYLAHGLR
jgi:Tol biopolymer transport system component